MYGNILVAIEPTHEAKHEQALKAARDLAETFADITALTVIEPLPGNFPGAVIPSRLVDEAGEVALGKLRGFVGARSEIKTVLLHGDAAHQILEYARSHDVDCIVIASHSPGLADYFLGSTAARVVRHAPCAVHVLR